MARPIVLSNGGLHVGINNYGLVHDFYFPYVGLENHSSGQDMRHRVGVWIDGSFSWLDDGQWQIDFSYPHDALIGHIVARNDSLQMMLEFDDAVDAEIDAFMRSIQVINLADQPRQIRLFMHQAFAIGDSRSNTDTAQYLPENNALLHYRGQRAFVIGGRQGDQPFDQFTLGLFGIEGREGTWRDAEDGELEPCVVEHGRVDSTLGFTLDLEAHDSTRVDYWIAAGTSLRGGLQTHKLLEENGVPTRLQTTARSWHDWLEPVIKVSRDLPDARRSLFIRSAMLVRSHIDKRGAVIASTDSTMLNYSRDAYAYSWPRDGAYVMWPLIRLGYTKEPLSFFDFSRDGLHPSGYLMHKYRADGALGSSWHPYLQPNGDVAAPVQIDETALTLFIFTQYYQLNPSDELLQNYYQSFVRPMAAWLAGYIDPQTNLPKASYDLWEENYMVSSYSTAITYAALMAASDLAESAAAPDAKSDAVAWRSVADDIRQAAPHHLVDKESGVILKGLIPLKDGQYEPDTTLDMSAVFGSFMYGLFGGRSQTITDSIAVARERFEQDTRIGLPRYENDAYRRPSGEILSNYWHITTLWHAQYCLETGDNEKALRAIDWVGDHTYQTGVLAEQILPEGENSTSVAPLTWSHAEYMSTILDLIGGEVD